MALAMVFFVLPLLMMMGHTGFAAPTAMIVLGDSLVDVGMNNHIRSLARANFPPNGIDYPNHVATGRFCNGFLISDYLSAHWNMQPALAYTDPNNVGQTLLLGVNFASAGAGILNDTGNIFINRFRMSDQIELFRQYRSKLTGLIGEAKTTRFLDGALVSVTIGSNDFLSNYFLPLSPRRSKFTIPQFIDLLLIPELSKQIQAIYDIGARKIVISNAGPFGCLPLVIGSRIATDKGKCVESFQEAAIAFNARLKPFTQELQQSLPGATVLYSNGFDIVTDMINNPSKFGFTSASTACCGRGPNKGIVPCNPTDPVCDDRSKFVFWDPFHPTQAVNQLIAQRVLFGSTADISPMNLSQLFP